jgi:AraC-like DNA-binding protein
LKTQYLPSDPTVIELIHSIWQVDYHTSHHKECIIPKGIVEIIFNFSDGSAEQAQSSGNALRLPHCFINGFNTTPINLSLPEKQVFFGVLIQPLAVKKLFGPPAASFADLTVDLTLIDPGYLSLWHQLAEEEDFTARVEVFLNWLRQQYIALAPQEQLINRFLYAHDKYDLPVTQLAAAVCYSPRHLSRKIAEATGMNTEEVLLYKKYLHAVNLIHLTELPLTAIAYQSQFTDQSHFIRTFRAYTGMTPGEYRRNKSFVKGHLYKDVR